MAGLITSECQEMLRSAARWHLLSLLFERPHDGWRATVESLAGDVDDDELREIVRIAVAEAGESLYLAVLGPGGEASPREVAYRNFSDPGQVLAELTAFYRAFAYAPVTEDPPDHVSVETGFIGYLRLKEAFARAADDAEAEAIAAEAAGEFLREHLAVIASSLAGRIQAHGDTYLAAAARVLGERVGFTPPESAVVPRMDDDDSELGCGGTCPL